MKEGRWKQIFWTVVAFAVAMGVAYLISENTTLAQTPRLLVSGVIGLIFGLVAAVITAPQE